MFRKRNVTVCWRVTSTTVCIPLFKSRKSLKVKLVKHVGISACHTEPKPTAFQMPPDSHGVASTLQSDRAIPGSSNSVKEQGLGFRRASIYVLQIKLPPNHMCLEDVIHSVSRHR